MNEFPHLEESSFIKTRRQFHAIAQIIGKIRETLVKPIAKSDNLWLSITGGGFSMPAIEQYSELEIGCNPENLIVEIANNKKQYDSIVINGKSRKEVCDELLALIRKYGITAEIDLSEFESDRVFNIEEQDAKNFHTQFVNYNALLSDFHKRVKDGVKTQICLWPHHFDNSFKWFSGRKFDDGDEQMGIGVSNGDDTYELPYISMTLWPALRKTNTLEIPEGASLHDSDWTGMILPYDSIVEMKSAEEQKKLTDNFFDVSFASIKRGFSKR